MGIEQGKLESIENGLKELLGYIDPRPTCHFIPGMLDGVHYLIVAVEPSSRPSTTKDKALGKFGLRLGRNDEINDEINASGRENDEISYGIALTEDELLLVDTLAKQPHGTYAQFAQELGWSEAKVYRLAKSLREKGVIERTGSRKTGHWEVLGKLGEGTPHE